jgi:dienelactone hydrolase
MRLAMSRWLLVLLVSSGCAPSSAPPETLPAGVVFKSTGSSFETGPLEVRQLDVREGEAGAPKALRITAPVVTGTYPVVQFQHGFLLDRRAYDEVLSQLASHGFVVVAPQMYAPDGVPLGKQSAQDEAAEAGKVADWSLAHAASMVGSAADPRPIGLAGHSRGGKVTWLLANGLSHPTRGIVGVDPVDGRGGPLLSAQPEALPASLASGPASFILGMELSGTCAPEGDNYRHFFDRSAAPTQLLLVKSHGHTDMLDADADTGGLCFQGPERAAVRRLTGGVLAAFFRWKLQDDDAAQVELANAQVAPLEVSREGR